MLLGFNCSLNWDRNDVNHSRCLTTTMIVKQNLFLCSREKVAFRKNLITIELFHQPYMHIVIAIVHHSLWCEFASTFNVLTRFGLQRLMLQVSYDE